MLSGKLQSTVRRSRKKDDSDGHERSGRVREVALYNKHVGREGLHSDHWQSLQ